MSMASTLLERWLSAPAERRHAHVQVHAEVPPMPQDVPDVPDVRDQWL